MAVMADGVLYVDNTTLSALASCDTKVLMQYGYNLKSATNNNAPAVAGAALHAGLEAYYMGATPDEALEQFAEAYYEYSLHTMESAQNRLGYDNLARVLSSWFDRYPINELPYKVAKPSDVEIPFDLPLTSDGRIRYVGRIDAIVQRTDGMEDLRYVLDTKTTGNPDTKFHAQFEIGSQMTGYCWAAWRLYNRMPAGVFINVVHASVVPTSNYKCSRHKTSYAECGFLHPKHELKTLTRSESAIESWYRDACRLAERWYDLLVEYGDDIYLLGEVSQNGKWVYQQCALCEFRDFCRVGRPIESDQFQFVPNEWVPGDLGERIESGALVPDSSYGACAIPRTMEVA